jgi:hypothetical protein
MTTDIILADMPFQTGEKQLYRSEEPKNLTWDFIFAINLGIYNSMLFYNGFFFSNWR